MLDKVRSALRIKSDAFDREILGLISSGLADMRIAGISIPNDDDDGDDEQHPLGPLIERAVILYAKANFGFFDDSEKYQKAYDHLKISLGLAGDDSVE